MLNPVTNEYLHQDITEGIITSILYECGMPGRLTGYAMIIESAMIVAADRNKGNKIHENIYPIIAECFDMRPINVERNIRYAIEKTYEEGSISGMHKYFGNLTKRTTGKVGNKEFIIRLADLTRQRMAQMQLEGTWAS